MQLSMKFFFYVREKSFEMISGFYELVCVVEYGKIMIGLVWFGLVFEKEIN